jgi:hypothetical protein
MFVGVRLAARELSGDALHNRDAIARSAAFFLGAIEMRLDDRGALRVS